MIIVQPYYPFTVNISAMFLSKVLKTKRISVSFQLVS